MSETSHNLGLPYISAAQAQKHVTHNEAIRTLDSIVQLSVADRDLAAPPLSPAPGQRFIVAAAATGSWAGHEGKIAAFEDGAWAIHTPRAGWLAWVADENALVLWNGTMWVGVGGGDGSGSTLLNPASGALVGINATADATNRLSVSSPASLFNHDGGGHQQKINKATAGDTASVLFQTGFSGRAEFGLTGDDDYNVKVSPDGSSWKEAMRIDRASGVVSFPFTPLGDKPNLLVNGDFGINQRGFAFGALADGVYGVDRWRAAGASNIGWNAATQTLTLNAGAIRQVVEVTAWGYASLASQQVTVSVEGLTGGNLIVAVGSASGAITPGSGRRSLTLTLGAGDTGNLNVTLTPTSYPTWWKRVKLEVGAAATDWQARPSAVEVDLCQRYFSKSMRAGIAPADGVSYNRDTAYGIGGGLASDVAYGPFVNFPTRMRDVPTIAFYRTNLGTVAGQWEYLAGGWVSTTSMSVPGVSETGFVPQMGGSFAAGAAIAVVGGWTASAEL
ncbi:MAG: hypothetical protein CTY20_03040 [Hyphomicrobium sp.]|nr:MAG: hypothetical protein CTY20_03040 [Hyphomicrobium sp.]